MKYLLHQAIPEFAKEVPDKDAFRIDEQGLTYRELEEASNRLAHWLREKGVKKGDRVGLFLTKSLELPVAIYGVLKAGAAYVPIDPSIPVKRVQFIIEDCGIKLLISNSVKIKFLKSQEVSGLQGVLGGEPEESWAETTVYPWQDLDSESCEPLKSSELALLDQDLAYIIYTSGSTGVPKGMMHTHRSGLSYVEMSAHLYEVGLESRLGNHASLHFDISTFDYLTGPNRGATTIMIPEVALMFPVEVVNLIRREQLTHWYSVPLGLIQLLERGKLETEEGGSSMRWVLSGGEPLGPKYLHRLRRVWPQAHFSNSYGPTEVNQCTYFHIKSGESYGDEAVPLGDACPNYELIVLNEDDLCVEEGEGELLVRTSTMMAGYWNREDLNEKAFYFRKRISGFPERFYRTGDLVSVDQHGVYHFLGRKDRQIKIRGYRLELDEVERVLLNLPEVEEAAVVIGEDAGEKWVKAAVTVCQEGITASRLSQQLKGQLPSYGIPEEIKMITVFPRTGSDKIDRREVKKMLFPT